MTTINLSAKTTMLVLGVILFGCEYKDITSTCSGELTQVSFDYLTRGIARQCWFQNVNETPDDQGRPQQQLDLIIQTQADYEKYIGCSDTLPKIDFTNKTLLAGRFIASSRSFVLDQNVHKDCWQNYFFNVQLNSGNSHALAKIYYFAIIPKISKNSKVAVTVTYSNACVGDSTQVPFVNLVPPGDYHYGCILRNIGNSPNVIADIGLADLVTIQTQTEYDEFVTCRDPLGPIDFRKQTLLAGTYVAANADPISSQNVYMDCNGNCYLSVHLMEGVSPTITQIYFFVIIPKISTYSKGSISVVYD